MTPIRVFVGYDPREAVGYSVFCHSVLTRTRAQVSFTPVRGERRDGSTDFTYSRFDVAAMCGYRGRAVWADGDMLCRSDIAELVDLLPLGADVAVVQHEYLTKHRVKFLGARNDDYPCKNWSSLMVIECGQSSWRNLTDEDKRKYGGTGLHRFAFMPAERVAKLPQEWNHLVGEYDPNPAAKLAHFTIGLPCWAPYDTWEFADEWRAEHAAMNAFQEAAA